MNDNTKGILLALAAGYGATVIYATLFVDRTPSFPSGEPPKIHGLFRMDPSEGEGESIELPCDWAPQTTFEYQVERRWIHSQERGWQKARGTHDVVVRVLQGGNPAVVSYQSSIPTFENLPHPIDIDLHSETPAMHVELVDGSPTTLLNHQDVAEHARVVLQRVNISAAGSEFMDHNLKIAEDPTTGGNLLLSEPAMLLNLNCAAYRPGEVRWIPDERAIYGRPVPGITVARYGAHDEQTLTIRYGTRLDGVLLGDLVLETTLGIVDLPLNPQQLETAATEARKAQRQIVTTVTHSREDGFPLEVTSTETSFFMGTTLTSEWIYTRVPPQDDDGTGPAGHFQ